MSRGLNLSSSGLFALILLKLAAPLYAQQPSLDSLTNSLAQTAPTPTAPSPPTGGQSTADAVRLLLHQSYDFLQKDQLDAALDKANSAIQIDPKSLDAYGLRGSVYTEKKLWAEGEKDFQIVLQLSPDNAAAKFNLSEIKFRQKLYDDARPGFVALEKDPNLGDLSSYKVFLCDLLAGHEDVATREHDAFNQIGSDPSYYFGNAFWSLYHHQTEDARGWLLSGIHIYSPAKVNLYTASLKDLGYLPLPPPPANP